ncbi:MAG TPA: nicotinate (nicotinamide) nucleotide adenylyltransferase [Firmicutes bacterium]|nr:nicotinate (nicotinamide) nucleotide adenylyltransferase [Bacillota bacterium]
MKIGVFGGSFNPPHKMHEKIAKDLVNRQIVDKIIFVPTGGQYKYKSNLVDDQKRYEMIKLITNKDERLVVSDYELKDHVVYTCETLAHFKEEYPNDEIYFICGTDNLSYIDKWKNGEEILRNYKILVIDRSSNDISELLEQFKEYKNNIVVAPIEQVDISSTGVRELIVKRNYKELEKYLYKDIIEYIKKNKLYENGELK